MRYLFLVFISFFIISCGTTDENSTTKTSSLNSNDSASNLTNTIEENVYSSSVIDDLNQLRINSGMIALNTNEYLNKSAYNHALYLDINNYIGHYEDEDYKKFTGRTPADRAVNSGYESRVVSENLSVGQLTESLSLKGLMGAIYHRFGFLDFKINTIGYEKVNQSYVYNMANSDLNNLCYGNSYDEHDSYYIYVCKDTSFKIEVSTYNYELNKTINSNPSYVIYPYANQENVPTSFYDETPDPLPSYKVSGYPISIEFNENQYNMDKFSIKSFIIYDENNNPLELAADYKDSDTILSATNDTNSHFNSYQFAIFSKDRLKYNTHYNVKFTYTYDGKDKEILWGFTTESLTNIVNYQDDLTLKANTSYNIYIKPENKDDIYTTSYISCSYSGDASEPTYHLNYYDNNTLSLNIEGSSLVKCDLYLNKDKSNEKHSVIHF